MMMELTLYCVVFHVKTLQRLPWFQDELVQDVEVQLYPMFYHCGEARCIHNLSNAPLCQGSAEWLGCK